MSQRKFQWDVAVEHLHDRCEHLSAFIHGYGSRRLPLRREGSPFAALARAIAYQQLSGKAAGTIHGRFLDLFPGREPDPVKIAAMPIEALRAVGLSQAKSLSIQDLARHTIDGSLPSPWKMVRMPDDEIIERLCQVRGIGPWTAQMYLIFNLGRPDVMPATDLAIQKGVQNVYRMRALPKPEKVLKHTRKLAPYRSVASWYFWRASEL